MLRLEIEPEQIPFKHHGKKGEDKDNGGVRCSTPLRLTKMGVIRGGAGICAVARRIARCGR